jgi:glycosyltransferase involved in cell wall biosynthesis
MDPAASEAKTDPSKVGPVIGTPRLCSVVMDNVRGANDFSRRVLVITADTLTRQMAGPAIRALHIAEFLSPDHEVKLVSTVKCTIQRAAFDCIMATDKALRDLVDWSDVVIFQGFVLHDNPFLETSDKIIVVDIYDPMHLEQLEQRKGDDLQLRLEHVNTTTAVFNQQLRRGDFFLCASEEQRYFWLGQLAALGRLNPLNYDRDDSLRLLIDVAPFGLSKYPPVRTGSAIKGMVPGISVDDQVILWGGGVYNWFDPLSVLQAVDRLRTRHEDVRLFFMGLRHPNPSIPEMGMAWEARQLSNRLGLTDNYVFFNEDWVDYSERQNYLLDADVGVSAHFLHVETSLSFRTRMLDYLWAGLPIVATEGDTFARLIDAERLGLTVPEMDVEALANALEKVLYDETFRKECANNVARVRERFTWERTLQPLAEFCSCAVHAADWEHAGRTIDSPAQGGLIRRNLQYVKFYYRRGGLGLVLSSGRARVQRVLAARH